MKKLFIFCSSLLIFICISGQKTPVKKPAVQPNTKVDFCAVMQKLITHSNTNFKSLKTGKHTELKDENGKYLNDGELSKLKLPGAKASFIKPLPGYPDMFIANFGVYARLEVARKKGDSLSEILKSCLTQYDVEFHQSSNSDYPFSFYCRGKNTDSLKPHDLYLRVSREVPANLSQDDYYVIDLTIHGRKKIEVPKIEKKYILINPSLQEPFLPNQIKDLYLGMSVEELNKRHPAAVLSDNGSKNWIEKFSTGDIEEIMYQTEFESPVVYEFIIKYRTEQNAITVARYLYEKSKTATKKTRWNIKLQDGLPIECWIADTKVCIMKMAYTKLNNQ